MKNTVGIIGAGHLIRHMMPSLARSGARFMVSQRGRDVSSLLAEKYGAEVSADNQAIVDASDIVIIAVRPFDAVAICETLEFCEDQTALSLCAGLSSAEFAPAVVPATLVMAMPVVAAEFGESPTLLYPENAPARTLLETCGPVLALDREADFAPAATIACYYGWVKALVGEMAGWLEEHGVNPKVARELCAQMTRAAATSIRERPDASIMELVDELATPRSFTLKGLEVLRQADAFTAWKQAAESLLKQR